MTAADRHAVVVVVVVVVVAVVAVVAVVGVDHIQVSSAGASSNEQGVKEEMIKSNSHARKTCMGLSLPQICLTI